MSCVLNTMSERVCEHFGLSDDGDLVGKAQTLSVIAGFEDHPSAAYAQKYIDTLAEKGVNYLLTKVIVDRGALRSKYMDEERLPVNAEMEDRVLRILALL